MSTEVRRRSLTSDQEVVESGAELQNFERKSSLTPDREVSNIESMAPERDCESPITRGVNEVLRFCGTVVSDVFGFLKKEDSDEEDFSSPVVTEKKRKGSESIEDPAAKSVCVADNGVETEPFNSDFLTLLKQINGNLGEIVQEHERVRADFDEIEERFEGSWTTLKALITAANSVEDSEREAKLSKLQSDKQELERLMDEFEGTKKTYYDRLSRFIVELDKPLPPNIEK